MVYCYYISHAGMKHMKSSNIWNTVFIVCIMRILEFTTCFSPCMPSRLISLLKSFEIIFVLCIRLDTTSVFNICISFFFIFLGRVFHAFPVGPVHCSWDSQTSFFSKTFIKNRSHGTIHTFKNYFVIVFSIFNGIQMDPICI